MRLFLSHFSMTLSHMETKTYAADFTGRSSPPEVFFLFFSFFFFAFCLFICVFLSLLLSHLQNVYVDGAQDDCQTVKTILLLGEIGIVGGWLK